MGLTRHFYWSVVINQAFLLVGGINQAFLLVSGDQSGFFSFLLVSGDQPGFFIGSLDKPGFPIGLFFTFLFALTCFRCFCYRGECLF